MFGIILWWFLRWCNNVAFGDKMQLVEYVLQQVALMVEVCDDFLTLSSVTPSFCSKNLFFGFVRFLLR